MGHAAGSQAKNSCSVFAMVFVTRRRLDRREFRQFRQRLPDAHLDVSFERR